MFFFWPFGFRGSVAKLCRLLPPWNMPLVPKVKSVVENGTEAKIRGRVMGVRVLVMMRFRLGDSRLGAATTADGGDNTGDIQGLHLQGESPRSDLSWLNLAMFLLETLFCEHELSPR